MHKIPRLLILVGLFGLYRIVLADHPADPLFDEDSVLEVEIAAPIRTLMRERPFEEYVEGKFSYIATDGQHVSFDIGLRTRGRFRRREDVCDFAPIRINFKKSQTKNTLFHKQDKLKLVTHCENRSPNYEQSVAAEFVAYRVFNLLSDISFRARLLRVTYVDTDRDNRRSSKLAILIEHRDRLGKREHIEPVDVSRIASFQLEPEYGALGAVFQYFLGNTDFSQLSASPNENCCHNHEPFQRNDRLYYSVPYDFDMTGFVEAPHAQPYSRRLRSVRDRLYRGRCIYNDHVSSAVERFVANKDEIYALIESQATLKRSKMRDQTRFVDSFFESVSSPSEIEKNLISDCR